MEEEMEICSNCKREIRSVNYVTHSVHCHRNIVVCNKCNEPVPRAELAEHDANEHRLKSCRDCGAQVEKALMQKHVKEDCSHRKVVCTFCEIELPSKELADHESYCGTRTEKCAQCGEFVMIKYQALHLDSNHGFLKLEDEPGPPPSWEVPAKPPTKIEPSRPILKSAIRPASSLLAASAKKSVPNTVRFAPVEKSPPPAAPEPTVEERQTKFGTNKIGAEVKPIVCKAAETVLETEKKTVPIYDEEADRLLAFKLAQDEMEMMSKYQLDGILEQRRKIVDQTSEKKSCVPEKRTRTSPVNFVLPAAIENMGAVGGKPKEPVTKQKNPDSTDSEKATTLVSSKQETYKPPEQAGDFEDVQIPCEFCEILVPASRLLIHQTGCRPDLACYIPYKYNKIKIAQPEQDHENQNNISEAAKAPNRTKTIIPCDLCNANIPPEKFIQHQLACEIKHLPVRADKPKALVMPLSGRTLRASHSIEESILPALETLEKEVSLKPGLRNCMSAGNFKDFSDPSSSSGSHSNDGPCDSDERAKQGAVPKQKPKSIKKYRAPQPPQLDKV
ncbi:TRAF-type zinc finger domain-containing protein 1-like isoform X2 [Neocloeon triangulifer]|uniref:TRAF-type zinc finger domain-containing protein 1-like isoform X2 n=1 Tax=Neocloeon triangulifer TaxID=2078957 RepID=UPI00286F5315|nr:TRAF-type zinc finger domain-containing protein 1-like isoform X2 [Neocloeon triangulifer]